MFLLGYFAAQTRGVMFARAEDIINVVFVREPSNLFNPSCVKVGLPGQVCIYTMFEVFRGQSHVYSFFFLFFFFL